MKELKLLRADPHCQAKLLLSDTKSVANFLVTIFVSCVASTFPVERVVSVDTFNIVFHYTFFNFLAFKNIGLLWRADGARYIHTLFGIVG